MGTTIVHPQAHLLAPAATLLADVESGHWGAVAHLVNEQLGYLNDVQRCADELNALFAASGYIAPVRQEVPSFLSGTAGESDAAITFETTRSHTASIVDLFTRVLIGQWREIDMITRWAATSLGNGADFIGERVGHVRVSYQKEGAYPEHPSASWGVYAHECGQAAHLGYATWKALGGGVADRQTPAIDGVVPIVRQEVLSA